MRLIDAHAHVPHAFRAFRDAHVGTVDYAPLPRGHDVFISYSQRHAGDADLVRGALEALRPGIRVFRDVASLRAGREYREQLDRAIRGSARVAALYSPEYLASDACKVEFNTAWSLRRGGAADLLFPMFVRAVGHDGREIGPALDGDARKTELHWEDCREGERDRIERACERRVDGLPPAPRPGALSEGSPTFPS